MSNIPKAYIGDGVYLAYDGWNLIVTTENGLETTNEIVLESPVWERLKVYADGFLNPPPPPVLEEP